MSRLLQTGWQFAACLLAVLAVAGMVYMFAARWSGNHHAIQAWEFK